MPDGGQRIKNQIQKLTENINVLKMNPPGHFNYFFKKSW